MSIFSEILISMLIICNGMLRARKMAKCSEYDGDNRKR